MNPKEKAIDYLALFVEPSKDDIIEAIDIALEFQAKEIKLMMHMFSINDENNKGYRRFNEKVIEHKFKINYGVDLNE